MPTIRSHVEFSRVVFLATVVALVTVQGGNSAAPDVILRAADASLVRGAWSIVSDASAAGGSRIANPDAGAAKLAVPLASPANYFELTFSASANTAYRLWMRGKAQGNSYNNDSVYVQYSDSVTAAGAATWRMGSTSATAYILEDCSGCNVAGWGWQDNGYGTGVLGPLVYFQTTGTHTIRIQVREDGLSLDQIVLSPSTYLTQSPGATKNDNTRLIGGAPAVTLVREPYLQQVFDRSAIIVWASREPGPASAVVAAQTVSATTTFFPASATGMTVDYYQHEATVTGLEPATTYAYDVYVGSVRATLGTDRLTTAATPGGGTVTFVVFGDSGTGSTNQQALSSLIANQTFDLALHAGDVVYGDTSGSGVASYTTYQSWFFDVYSGWLRRRPIFPIIGNHDATASNNWGAAYLSLFVLPENGGAGPYPDNAERYYSYDYGPVHFVALDTELAFQDTARRAAQLAWLDADLAATAQPWKVAYFHRPPYSSGSGHGSELPVRAAFDPIFERRGVQLVISGHNHDYERTVPWRESPEAGAQAVTYIVTGGGGAPLYSVGQNEWTAMSASVFHYVRTTIGDCEATIEAVDASGALVDRSVLDRCAQATDAAAPTVTITSPAPGATVSGTTPVTVDAADDVRVEKVDLWIDGALAAIDRTAPYEFAWDTTAFAPGAHTLEARAYDIDGNRTSQSEPVIVDSPGPGAGDIVIRAVDVPPSNVAGDWAFESDSTAASGVLLRNPNRNAAKVAASASPASYFDVTFDAQAGTPYHLWLRMRADGNSYNNDSVSVQFDGTVTSTGAAIYRIRTTAAAAVILEEGSGTNVHGWGWNDNAYGALAAPIYFERSGTQTIRIQVREDGVSIDQIVMSPSTYLTRAPGTLKDDATIVPR